MLITDHVKLLSLLITLQDDIDLCLGSIDSEPKEADKTACSEFLQGLASFLKQAAERDFQQFKDKAWMIVVDQPQILSLVSVLSVDVENFIVALGSAHTRMGDSTCAEFLQRMFDFLEQCVSIIEEETEEGSPRSDSRLLVTTSFGSPIPASLSSPPPRPAPAYRTLIFKNPSPNATTLEISELIFGGPLQSINRRDPNMFGFAWGLPLHFELRFLKSQAACVFLAFLDTARGHHYLPANNNTKADVDWSPFEELEPFSETHTDPATSDNLSRRVLIFEGYPAATVSEGELIERLRALYGGSAFRARTLLRFTILAETSEAHLLFTSIEIAVRVMEFWKLGLLGDEFNDCRVFFGKDPSDRPFPLKLDGTTPIPSWYFYENLAIRPVGKDEIRSW